MPYDLQAEAASLSKVGLIIVWQTVGMVQRRIAIGISPATRAAVKRQEGERRCKTKQLYPNQTTYSRSLFRDIFHWKEVNKYRTTCSFYIRR